MTKIVNLRQARKAKARADREKQAAENRAKHGRPRAERDAEQAEETRRTRALDAHRKDEDPA